MELHFNLKLCENIKLYQQQLANFGVNFTTQKNLLQVKDSKKTTIEGRSVI